MWSRQKDTADDGRAFHDERSAHRRPTAAASRAGAGQEALCAPDGKPSLLFFSSCTRQSAIWRPSRPTTKTQRLRHGASRAHPNRRRLVLTAPQEPSKQTARRPVFVRRGRRGLRGVYAGRAATRGYLEIRDFELFKGLVSAIVMLM
jgi:hypothetical protein